MAIAHFYINRQTAERLVNVRNCVYRRYIPKVYLRSYDEIINYLIDYFESSKKDKLNVVPVNEPITDVTIRAGGDKVDVRVKPETKLRLLKVKVALGELKINLRSYDDIINYLINYFWSGESEGGTGKVEGKEG